jgi:hypothetical protein
MLHLELIFLRSAHGGGCNAWDCSNCAVPLDAVRRHANSAHPAGTPGQSRPWDRR